MELSSHQAQVVSDGAERTEPSGLLVLRMNLNETTYALPHQRRAFAEDLVRRAEILPGVESVAVMNIAPHTWQSLGSPFTIEGRPPAGSAEQPFCLVESVGADYLRAMRIPESSPSLRLDSRTSAGQADTSFQCTCVLSVTKADANVRPRRLPQDRRAGRAP